MTLTIINQKKIGGDNFTRIGQGAHGDVYIVEDEHGEKMAVKIISPKSLSMCELDVLTRLKSPYIIRSMGDPVVEIQHSHGITLELKENCIYKLNTKKLPYYQLKRIMVSCLFGLRCMHAKGFLHNDLVLRNILYDKDENGDYLAYLADFSVTVRCIDAQKGIRVKRIVKGSHTPIEILESLEKKRKKNYRYNDKTDIWSLGLCFLEMIDRKLYFPNISEQLEFYDSLNADFIKGKVKLYNRGRERESTKMNKKEELYLTELLTHMLKKNPEDRMGSNDLMYLNFIKTTSIPYDCSLNKPTELVIVPVSESRLKSGLNYIRDFFEMSDEEEYVSAYFLSIQIYIRIMNQIIIEDSSFDMEEVIEISINSARNYYNRSIESGFEAPLILKGEIGYNPFFYAANYLEELRLIDYYIDHGDNFMPSMNVINPYELFHQFRLMYDYGDENKITNSITYNNYRQIRIPQQKENIDYSNVLEDNDHKSLIEREKDVEQIFNGILIEYIKDKISSNWNKDFPDIYDLAKEYIEGGTQVKRKDIYSSIRKKDIFTNLIGINKYFDYGIIKIEQENIVHHIFEERKFVVVMKDKIVSLIHLEDRVATHYYSDRNELVKQFYEERGYEYKMNFDYGINSCCKVIDSCILFIIFYNNFLCSRKKGEEECEKNDLSIKCISEETNFVIFLSLFLQ